MLRSCSVIRREMVSVCSTNARDANAVDHESLRDAAAAAAAANRSVAIICLSLYR